MTAVAYLFAFLKNAIYGTTNFFTKDLNEGNLDAIEILALRFLLSFVVLWILKTTKILNISVGVKDIFKSTEKHTFIKPLLLTALFSPVIEMLFETTGFTMTTAVTAGVILSLMPIFACICEAIILKESTTFMQKLFLVLGIIGVIYIGINTDTSDGKDSILGIVCLLIATISGPLHLVFSRQSLKVFKPFEVSYFACLFGTVVFNFINIVKHIINGDILHYFDPYFDPKNILSFIMLSVISTVIATGMNNFSMRKLQASTVAAFSGISTIVTILIGVVLLDEKLYMYHYIGFALILLRMIGVSYIAIKKDKKNASAK